MTSISIDNPRKQILTFKWKPSGDLAIVALSWILVVGALYTATNVIGQKVWGGMGYFLMYALVSATLFGIGIPLYWMGVVRKHPLADLGLTTRGWVQLRLEKSFGAIPAILIASLLYAAYHIGYGMLTSEMVFLFFVGIMFAVVFCLTRSVLILWPLFQPTGQLITLLSDNLSLPLIAALGFVEVFIVMLALVWLVARYQKRTHIHPLSQAKAL